MDIAELLEEFGFNEPTDCEITSVNGITVPDDYLSFMREHDGGEGPVGEEGYMQLVMLEELVSFNEDYEIPEHFPEIFIFGTDLGGVLFGYDSENDTYCAVDSCSIDRDDIRYAGNTFDEFLQAAGRGEL